MKYQQVETPGTEKEHNKQKSLLPSFFPPTLPLDLLPPSLSSFSPSASLGVTSPLGPFCFLLLNLFLLLLILAGDISTWQAGGGAESKTFQSKLPEPGISEQSSHNAGKIRGLRGRLPWVSPTVHKASP